MTNMIQAGEDSDCLLVVRKLSFAENAIHMEAVMNLGPDLVNPRTAILCPHMILVSHFSSLSLYRIPELRPACNDGTFNPAVSIPLATHSHDTPVNEKLIWNTLCPHFDGHLATYTFSEEDAVLILPSPGQSKDEFVRYVINGPCSMGYSRAIGCRDFIDLEPMELQCFTQFTRSDGHPGYKRLGRTEAPRPTHVVSIPLLGQDGRPEDISWDEESGRISVLFSPRGDRTTRKLLLPYINQ